MPKEELPGGYGVLITGAAKSPCAALHDPHPHLILDIAEGGGPDG